MTNAAHALGEIEAFDVTLLDEAQRDFPLVPQPFFELALKLGTSELALLEGLRRCETRGWLSRIGPVFRPKRLGESSLCAMAVPVERLDDVAALIGTYDEVNHSYIREHPTWNLWFVLTAPNEARLLDVMNEFERATGLQVLDLRLEEQYRIDLAFPLRPKDSTKAPLLESTAQASLPRAPGASATHAALPRTPGASTTHAASPRTASASTTHAALPRTAGAAVPRTTVEPPSSSTPLLTDSELKLVAAIQDGFALVPRPFALLAAALGIPEAEVLAGLRALVETGKVKRYGAVVRHRALGFTENAMCVWEIPDTRLAEVALRMAQHPAVTLCYRRRTVPGAWPFNLYCMIHGRTRAWVDAQVAELTSSLELGDVNRRILFSTREFKQRGAHYVRPKSAAASREQPSALHEQPARGPGGDAAVPSEVRNGIKSRGTFVSGRGGDATTPSEVTEFDRALINLLQSGLPVERRPFAAAAATLGCTETAIVERVRTLLDTGVLTRFGPMFNVERMGGHFSLVAMTVPEERFDEVNELVNGYGEVAHNYEREHARNMWFVVATEPQARAQEVLRDIEARTGLKTYDLPKEQEFFLELKLQA
jgi:DNA-binding Lrp family transcriptional regulator